MFAYSNAFICTTGNWACLYSVCQCAHHICGKNSCGKLKSTAEKFLDSLIDASNAGVIESRAFHSVVFHRLVSTSTDISWGRTAETLTRPHFLYAPRTQSMQRLKHSPDIIFYTPHADKACKVRKRIFNFCARLNVQLAQ